MNKPNETIIDRVVQRLQKQPLGDLITEEDLHDIVKQAIPLAFMAKRYVTEGSGFHERRIEKPPLIVEMAQQALEASVQKAVDQWMVDNADKLADAWRPVFEKGVEAFVMKQHATAVDVHIRNVLNSTFSQWNQQRASQGMPPIVF